MNQDLRRNDGSETNRKLTAYIGFKTEARMKVSKQKKRIR